MEYNDYKEIALDLKLDSDSVIAFHFDSNQEGVTLFFDNGYLKLYKIKNLENSIFLNLNDYQDIKDDIKRTAWVRSLIIAGVDKFIFFLNLVSLDSYEAYTVIDDHINMTGNNILRGKNIDEFGERFPDSTFIYKNNYSKKLISKYDKTIYLGFMGPIPATPAEEFAFRKMGADSYCDLIIDEALLITHAKKSITAIGYRVSRENYRRDLKVDRVADFLSENGFC
ncbi:MAG: hypothetical protein CR982_04265 [Candidatus Cloacimonadota bacterium]|nr:MAG: hypothetical protein CR982_04265 [Candidatus Cloacimonadota bacterium]PIE78494.1 MAG: hypothetical protein CSA15_07305 [Candidatus Delongbacteria bacterium]